MMVIKKDNSRVPYDRSKIEAGIVRSCHKRPISTQQINQIVDEIENEIFSNNEREVPTSQIGELVMQKLKAVDQVAYVRFASVYREFKDINTFVDEIGELLKSQESK
jgi:transcriptional repressor NrdR